MQRERERRANSESRVEWREIAERAGRERRERVGSRRECRERQSREGGE